MVTRQGYDPRKDARSLSMDPLVHFCIELEVIMVDAVWEEMQREASRVDVSKLLSRSMASTKTKRAKPTTAPSKSRSLVSKDLAKLSIDVRTETKSGRQLERPETAEPFSLSKELNRLADERPSVRKQAALTLETHLLREANENGNDSDDQSLSEIAKPLFKRFNDPIEKVREVCIKISTKLVAAEEDLLRVLPYLMPAIANRINSRWGYDEENQVFTRDQFLHDAFKRGRVFVKEEEVTRIKPTEPSEEIRLLFLDLIAALLQNIFARNASSILHAYVFDILLILVASVNDDFHDINIRACGILQKLCNNMVSVMKHFTVGFVRASKHLLIHRLARVRVAGIECIRALVACPNFEKCKGSGTESIVDLIGHRDENVIPIAAFYTGEVRFNFFAKLDQDSNPLVRNAFYALIEDWILNLPDRYDHESRLMPYLLSAVSDELDEISQRAMRTLEELGKRYEQEHGEEVIEMKQYGVDGMNPTYNYRKRLPAPFFDNRPSLGTRLYVRGRTRRFLNPLLRELENWQSPTRAHAVRLLKSVLVFGEETITVDAHTLIQTLLKTWSKEGAENAVHFQEIADLVGRFVAPKTYLPLMLPRIRGEEDIVGSVISPEIIGSALELFGHVMGGSLDKMLLPHVQAIVEVLCCANVVAFETSRVKTARARLLLQITELLQRRGRDAVSAFYLEHGRLPSLEKIFEQIFEMAVSLTPDQNSDTAQLAMSTLAVLRDVEGRATIASLYETHFDACFSRAASQVESRSELHWKPTQCEQLVIGQLLQHVSVEMPPQRLELVCSHFEAILLDAETNAKPTAARTRHYQQLVCSLSARFASANGVPEPLQRLVTMVDASVAVENATAA